ncbi:MAG TPA: protein translocase subunit SecDF, partial [Chitinophagaceae bacterium]|nr:protein translocase subunit SecDF [Chitinophagaceae bacterium]
MQLKGLVRFFAIALTLICLYQLSFTWIVHNHENKMEAKAKKWIKDTYASPEAKYSGNVEAKALYEDTLQQLTKVRLQRLLDSTKESKIGPFGLTTYQNAKDKELLLGLDLQGGMSVTMEVGLDGLIKSLSGYTKDAQFNTAIESAVKLKANSSADLVSLFVQEYKKINPSGKLAPFFATKSSGKIKFDDSDENVVKYLKEQSDNAFANTFRIVNKRIDKFGVASPNINQNPAKGIITVELAGVTDHERVRRYLQSTANLQFFEVYTLQDNELSKGFEEANKALQNYLNGVQTVVDTTKAVTTPNTTIDTTQTVKISDVTGTETTKDTSLNKKNVDPIKSLLFGGREHQPTQNRKGGYSYPAALAYVALKDTGLLNQYLALDIVKTKFPSNLVFMYGKAEDENGKVSKTNLNLYAIKTLDNGQAKIEGEHVAEAKQGYDGSRPIIHMNMTKEGTKLWGDLTTKNVDKPIAVVLDNFVYSAPNVNEPITTGSSQISGNYTVKEAQDMADILQTGKLPAPAKIVQEQIIGPTLGAEAVKGGGMSFLVSFLIIFALMLIYYNTGGWVANIALVLNLLFTIGILAALGFTLTSAGIAGLVLTIGMAVDTNVIIFERIKEELTKGKSYTVAVNDGYKRSLAPVLDSHVTSFLTAAILFNFGFGPILGFATTQMLGLSLSLFCGILVSRLITDIYASSKKDRHFQYFTKISSRIFKHATFPFVKYRKIAYVISVVILVLGIASFFNGFDQGVEFAGGRSYVIKFKQNVSIDNLRSELKDVFEGETPIIKTVGTADQLDITTSYKIHETGQKVDSLVEQTLFGGLKKYLPQGTTYYEFATQYKQRSQTVLPTISKDLKEGAVKAALVAVIMICLYIFLRFRDWRYSFGTIVSLMHDVFVTLIVFSFAKSIVPFPLEIDQHFIAAILTVIGFSMNDTVIVYDRIREDSKLYPSMGKEELVNTAINQTLSRTIMTSLTVFITILVLFIFGGEVTRGFSFAMLIG